MSCRVPYGLLTFLLTTLLVTQITAKNFHGWVVDQSGSGAAPQDTWWTGCTNNTKSGQGNTTLAYTINQQACLDWYYWGGLKDIWQGTICNGMGFFRGSHEYSDSAACYEKCYGCLSQSLQAGSTDAVCRDGHGYGVLDVMRGNDEMPNDRGPNCWIGFHKP